MHTIKINYKIECRPDPLYNAIGQHNIKKHIKCRT